MEKKIRDIDALVPGKKYLLHHKRGVVWESREFEVTRKPYLKGIGGSIHSWFVDLRFIDGSIAQLTSLAEIGIVPYCMTSMYSDYQYVTELPSSQSDDYPIISIVEIGNEKILSIIESDLVEMERQTIYAEGKQKGRIAAMVDSRKGIIWINPDFKYTMGYIGGYLGIVVTKK